MSPDSRGSVNIGSFSVVLTLVRSLESLNLRPRSALRYRRSAMIQRTKRASYATQVFRNQVMSGKLT